MVTTEEVVPGPLSKWKPHIVTNPNRVRLEDFTEALYPPPHLNSVENLEEAWGDPCNGYPHIENVFLKATSNYEASGNCYFNAIATLLYGSQLYWHTVKGHHLEYFDRALRDSDHPRHTLYTKLNSNLSKSSHDHGPGKNLWMRPCTPYAWQDGEILQVTADIYDVFIVQFTMSIASKSKVEAVKVRGNYNSTHWIIRYVNGNHFQPLIPANGPLSEFSFPPIMRENTEGKVSVSTNIPRGATDLNHPWRSPLSRQNVPEHLLPRQVFREMSTLNFSLISGFNKEDSTLDYEYLKLEYLCARNESLQYPPLADGMEIVTSKVIEKRQRQDDSDNESIFPLSANHTVSPFDRSRVKRKVAQVEAVEVTKQPPATPLDLIPDATTISATLKPAEVSHIPLNMRTTKVKSTKKRLLRFITREELGRQQAVKRKSCHY